MSVTATPPLPPRPPSLLEQAARARAPADLLPLLQRHFESLLVDRGDWNLSIYDLAWVLCCDFFGEAEHRKYLGVLLAAQHADGTWGDASYMPHSALVDTLAAVMALVRLGQPVPHAGTLAASVEALVLQCREYPHHDTVAFELVAPQLYAWLERRRHAPPLGAQAREFLDAVAAKGRHKLEKLRQHQALFEPSSTLSYTAELAVLLEVSPAEVEQLPRMMLPNGAIGLSPAATAAVILLLSQHGREVPPGLRQYLRDTFEDYQHEGFPNLHPIVTSRRLWNVRPWLVSGSLPELARDARLLPLLTRIYQETPLDALGRVSWDTNNRDLPDLDDTAVAFALRCVLVQRGVKDLQPMSPASFKPFQRKNGTFFCYPYELHPSPSALLHTVMAMDLGADTFGESFSRDPVHQDILRNLLEQLDPHGYDFDQLNHDKWHATWTYGVQKWLSLRTILATWPDRVREMSAEVLKRARPGGGWGQRGATVEETAYVTSGLARLLKNVPAFLTDAERTELRSALARARGFLVDTLLQGEPPLPALWISKNMYAPRFQVVASVLEALYATASLG